MGGKEKIYESLNQPIKPTYSPTAKGEKQPKQEFKKKGGEHQL